LVQEFFDAELKKMKVRPYYFPLFVTENVLQKDHIEGFAPEVCLLLLFFTSHFHLPPTFCTWDVLKWLLFLCFDLDKLSCVMYFVLTCFSFNEFLRKTINSDLSIWVSCCLLSIASSGLCILLLSFRNNCTWISFICDEKLTEWSLWSFVFWGNYDSFLWEQEAMISEETQSPSWIELH
jgi:hypothetical protein